MCDIGLELLNKTLRKLRGINDTCITVTMVEELGLRGIALDQVNRVQKHLASAFLLDNKPSRGVDGEVIKDVEVCAQQGQGHTHSQGE